MRYLNTGRLPFYLVWLHLCILFINKNNSKFKLIPVLKVKYEDVLYYIYINNNNNNNKIIIKLKIWLSSVTYSHFNDPAPFYYFKFAFWLESAPLIWGCSFIWIFIKLHLGPFFFKFYDLEAFFYRYSPFEVLYVNFTGT